MIVNNNVGALHKSEHSQDTPQKRLMQTGSASGGQ